MTNEQTSKLSDEWIAVDKPFSEYPKGTYARQSWSGVTWRKTGRGWKYLGGNTFPTPSDANQVRLIAKGE